MTVVEAEELLQRNNIDPLLYSVGAPMQTQCDVIEKENGVWITYHWERGARHFVKMYTDEASAAADFVDNVTGAASLNEHRIIVLR